MRILKAIVICFVLCVNWMSICSATDVPDDGQLVYSPLDAVPDYLLRPYLNAVDPKWTLVGLVNLAKNVVTSAYTIPWGWLPQLMNGTFIEDLDIMGVVTHELCLIIPFGLGVLTALFLPLVGLCFCCCRCCCGNCGGKLSEEQVEKQSTGCCGFTMVTLFTTLVILGAGAGCIVVSGNRITSSPAVLTKTALYIINDTLEYKDVMFEEVGQVAVDDLQFTVDALLNDIRNISGGLSSPFVSEAGTYLDGIVEALSNLTMFTTELNSEISASNTTAANLSALAAVLETGLNKTSTNLTAIKQKCLDDVEAFCGDLPNGTLIPTSFTLDVPDIANMTSGFGDALSMNFTNISSQVTVAFDSIPATINDSSFTVINDILAEIEPVLLDLTSMTEGMIQNLTAQVDMMINSSIDIGEYRSMIREYGGMAEEYVAYGKYGFLGVAGLALLVIAFSVFGIVCGVCGHHDDPRRRKSSGNCGGCMLMGSTCCAFSFGFLFFLLGSVLFFVFSHITAICQPIRDLTIFDKFVDNPDYWGGKYILGDALLGNGSAEVKIGDIIRACRANEALYSALPLESYFDINAMVNVSEMIPDMSSMMGSLNGTLNGTLANLTIMDEGTMDTLDSIGNATLALNVTQITEQLASATSSVDLVTLADYLDELATNMTAHPYYSNSYRDLAAYLRGMDSTTSNSLQSELTKLEEQLNNTSAFTSQIMGTVSTLANQLRDLESWIQNEASDTLYQGVVGYLDQITDYPSQYITHVTNRLNNDIGKCGVIWDIYDGLTAGICVYVLDGMNALWLSFGIVGFFFIVIIIANVKMSKYFRKPSSYRNEPTTSFVDFGMYHPNPKLRNTNNSVTQEEVENNNNANNARELQVTEL